MLAFICLAFFAVKNCCYIFLFGLNENWSCIFYDIKPKQTIYQQKLKTFCTTKTPTKIKGVYRNSIPFQSNVNYDSQLM